MAPEGPGGGTPSAALRFGDDPSGSAFSPRLASDAPALRLNPENQVAWTNRTIAQITEKLSGVCAERFASDFRIRTILPSWSRPLAGNDHRLWPTYRP